MMNGKKWYQSKTIWGSIFAVLSVALGYFGFSFGAEDQAQAVEAVVAVVGGLGGAFAVYGRVKASKKIEK